MSGNDENPKRVFVKLKDDYDRLLKELEEARAANVELDRTVMTRAEDLASAVVTTTITALMDSREMFKPYFKLSRYERLKGWFKNVRK